MTEVAEFPAGSTSRPPGRRRRWWLLAAVVGWALLLVAVAVVSHRRDRPTVPEQRAIAAALPAVDRAAGAVLAAIGPDRVFAIGSLIMTRDCQITPVRAGAEASRDITVYTAAGEAPAALDAIAAALPVGYRAEVRHRKSGTVHTLDADAGDFILIRGTVSGGVITLRADTGCRPLDGSVAGAPTPGAPTPGRAAGAPTAGAPAALIRALTALNVPDGYQLTTHHVACPGHTTARTVAANGIPAQTDLDSALGTVTKGARLVEAGSARYAYRTGDVSMVVTAADGKVSVAASTAC